MVEKMDLKAKLLNDKNLDDIEIRTKVNED